MVVVLVADNVATEADADADATGIGEGIDCLGLLINAGSALVLPAAVWLLLPPKSVGLLPWLLTPPPNPPPPRVPLIDDDGRVIPTISRTDRAANCFCSSAMSAFDMDVCGRRDMVQM